MTIPHSPLPLEGEGQGEGEMYPYSNWSIGKYTND
jgi:hypothetical protein